MLFTRLISVVRKLAPSSLDEPPEDLLSPDQLRRVLERERSRTDRTGESFSLLAFTPREQEPPDGEGVGYLIKVLRQRVRSTDEVGWLDAQRIGVVLPGAPAQGAWRVADDVCERFPASLPPPLCTVYAYPSARVDGAATPDGPPVRDPRQAAVALETLFLQATPLWKRTVDIVGATAGLLLLLPVLILVALAIKLSSPGPIFFKQWRSGRGGKPFLIYKFRSMVGDAEVKKGALLAFNEQDGPAFKIKNDPRVTRLGRFLRKTSLDELPQLWNILIGDMSLVGPRPLPCAESAACFAWQRWRLDVTPGLTGLWQVHGRGHSSFADWVRMDVKYIRSRSPWLDLKLLLLTVPAVMLRRGAH